MAGAAVKPAYLLVLDGELVSALDGNQFEGGDGLLQGLVFGTVIDDDDFAFGIFEGQQGADVFLDGGFLVVGRGEDACAIPTRRESVAPGRAGFAG
jgi:hypothetical protein